jgi:hypothetical protein
MPWADKEKERAYMAKYRAAHKQEAAQGLGLFKDSTDLLNRAIDYLRKYKKQKST